MTVLKSYPWFKVLLGIILSPALVGFFIGLLVVFHAIYIGEEPPHFWYWILFSFPFIIYSIFCYGLPAAILGVIAITMKIHNGAFANIFMLVLGGALTIIWSVFVRIIFGEPPFKFDMDSSSIFPYIPGFNDLALYILGSLSAFVMAQLVLPKDRIFINSKPLNCDSSDSEFDDEVLQFSASNLPKQK